jgi:flagellar biosynthesis component FlhA
MLRFLPNMALEAKQMHILIDGIETKKRNCLLFLFMAKNKKPTAKQLEGIDIV